MADLMADAAAPALGGELPISDQTSKEVSTQRVEGERSQEEGELFVLLHAYGPPHPPPYTLTRQETLKEMGEWAARYEMIAAMGYLAAVLMVGKALHNLWKFAKVGWKGRTMGWSVER